MKTSKIVSTVLLILGILISAYVAYDTNANILSNEANLIEIYSSRFESIVRLQMKNTEILEVFVNTRDEPITEDDFSEIALAMDDENIIYAISYEPNGYIEFIYPYSENFMNIGVNVFKNDLTRSDSLKARDTGNAVISGPYELFQGDVGFIVRNPIMKDGEFQGFSVLVLGLDELLNFAEMDKINSFGYEFQLITSYMNEEIVATQSEDFTAERANYGDIPVGDDTWRFGLYQKDSMYEIFSRAFFWFFLVLILNLILSYILRKFERTKANLNKKLETDALTGAYNRTKIEKFYKNSKNKKFALFFIDLNKFKPVNDNYGHEVGDKLLIAYVKRLQAQLKADTLVARIGGDEFALITNDVTSEDSAQNIKNRVLELSETPFSIDGIDINISASIGFVLSTEADKIDELLEIADKKMYAEKQKNKASR